MIRLYRKEKFFSKGVHNILTNDYNLNTFAHFMKIFLQNTLHMTKTSGYEEKFYKELFLNVLAANPPNLMRKNKKKISYNLLLTTTWLNINQKKFNLLGVGLYT